jgi:diamine N-acetyltransferase
LYRWENDASVWADGANHNPLSQQDLRDYIASTTGDIYKDGQLRLIIEQSPITNDQSPMTLGCIDLFDFDPRNRKAALGMYIAPE